MEILAEKHLNQIQIQFTDIMLIENYGYFNFTKSSEVRVDLNSQAHGLRGGLADALSLQVPV